MGKAWSPHGKGMASVNVEFKKPQGLGRGARGTSLFFFFFKQDILVWA